MREIAKNTVNSIIRMQNGVHALNEEKEYKPNDAIFLKIRTNFKVRFYFLAFLYFVKFCTYETNCVAFSVNKYQTLSKSEQVL